MQLPWFRRLGWVYRPVSVAGWFITLLTAVLIVWVFRAVDRHSHSASDTLIGVFPYAALFLILAGWVASRTCERSDAY